MTFTFHWWHICLILFFAPMIYAGLRKPGGDWDMQIDTMLCFAVCWMFAIGLAVGHFI
jgi:hypothetical protein